MPIRQQCRRRRQGRLDFIARQRLWQHLPLPRRLNIQRWIVIDSLIEKQVTIKMTQRRKFPSHAAPVHLMGKKLLQEFTHIVAPRREQEPFPLFQELGKLEYVGGIGGNRKPRQSLLDAQVIEKAGEHVRVRLRSHEQKTLSLTVIGHQEK